MEEAWSVQDEALRSKATFVVHAVTRAARPRPRSVRHRTDPLHAGHAVALVGQRRGDGVRPPPSHHQVHGGVVEHGVRPVEEVGQHPGRHAVGGVGGAIDLDERVHAGGLVDGAQLDAFDRRWIVEWGADQHLRRALSEGLEARARRLPLSGPRQNRRLGP